MHYFLPRFVVVSYHKNDLTLLYLLLSLNIFCPTGNSAAHCLRTHSGQIPYQQNHAQNQSVLTH